MVASGRIAVCCPLRVTYLPCLAELTPVTLRCKSLKEVQQPARRTRSQWRGDGRVDKVQRPRVQKPPSSRHPRGYWSRKGFEIGILQSCSLGLQAIGIVLQMINSKNIAGRAIVLAGPPGTGKVCICPVLYNMLIMFYLSRKLVHGSPK